MKWIEVPSVGSGMAVSASCSSSFDWQLVSLFCSLFHSPSVIQSVQGTQITPQARRDLEGGRQTRGEKREALTLEAPPGFSKSEKKVWRNEGRTRAFGDRRVKVLLFYRVLHQLNRMPWCCSLSTTSRCFFICVSVFDTICWVCVIFVHYLLILWSICIHSFTHTRTHSYSDMICEPLCKKQA